MPDDQDLAVASVRRLPPSALAGLREAFAAEVRERLPRLQAAAAGRRAPSGEALATVVRDAHALGSSAAVLSEPEASRRARATEQLLLSWESGDVEPSLPELADHVAALSAQLSGWTT